MKTIILQSLSAFFRDRSLVILTIGLLIGMITYIAYVGLSLSPTELQVATRYTAFGETQYYRTQWYYLLAFIGFAIIMTLSHIAIMVKLRARDMRTIAMGLGCLSIVILAILFVITRSVLGIAYLS